MAKRPVPLYDFKAFGAAIKAARNEYGESRKKVSDELYISPRYLANIENKGQQPSLSGVLSAWFRRLLICHGRMRNTAYSFITSFLGHIRVWDYPNKQNARALYGKRGHFSQTGTRLLCLLCSCFYPYFFAFFPLT